ncbi:alpha/beta fold hydrolase [Candidatus Tisiphia endosymbiont of Nedyus quadrimaculatus]|uniref:alpha/beta fold hydrolase n=1 Tax=Candidatus Tisiphia endosymbiont of Nedyus quadrimaculatus TaxID=3139332 RepID=UPI00345EF85C
MIQKFIQVGPYINWLGSQYIPAHKIAYLEFGDPNNENVIICAHGLTRNAHDFDKIAMALSDNFRVIAIDYPGRGDSDVFKTKKHYNYQVYVKDTVLFLKKLAINNCIWLGTSMGGIIGYVLASKYKELIKAMIINDVGPFIPAAPLVKIGQYAGQTPSFVDLVSAKQHLKLIYSQFGISSEEDWDHLTKYSFIKIQDGKYKMNYDPGIIQGMNANADKPKNVDIWTIWNKIVCKLLVIHGAKSEILQQDTIDKMKKTKDFDLFVVDYAGHTPSLMTDDQISYIKSWVNALKI